ncbi:hypothetical protein Tco_0281615 [Tanacetum coccineum]
MLRKLCMTRQTGGLDDVPHLMAWSLASDAKQLRHLENNLSLALEIMLRSSQPESDMEGRLDPYLPLEVSKPIICIICFDLEVLLCLHAPLFLCRSTHVVFMLHSHLSEIFLEAVLLSSSRGVTVNLYLTSLIPYSCEIGYDGCCC